MSEDKKKTRSFKVKMEDDKAVIAGAELLSSALGTLITFICIVASWYVYDEDAQKKEAFEKKRWDMITQKMEESRLEINDLRKELHDYKLRQDELLKKIDDTNNSKKPK